MANLKKNLVLQWFLILLVGGLGGVLLDRLVLPYLSTLSWFRDWPILSSATPLVINRREEIHIDEGINHAEVLNRVRGSLARVYIHEGEFATSRFRLSQVLSGVVVASDGVIALPTGSLRPELLYTVILSQEEPVRAKVVAADPLTGTSFLKIERNNLAVVKQGFSQKLRPGERVLLVTAGENPLEASLTPAAALGPAVPEPGLLRTYDFGRLNAFLLTDLDLSKAELGAVVVNQDAQLIGFVTQAGREKVLLRSEDLQLVVKNFLDDGKIVWPALKISYQILGPAQTKLLGFPRKYGILIKSAPATLRENDFLFAVNGRELNAEEDLQQRLLSLRQGEQVSLRLLRGGIEQEVKITLP